MLPNAPSALVPILISWYSYAWSDAHIGAALYPNGLITLRQQASALNPGLTAREIAVLRSWLKSDSKPVASAELRISVGTVNTHITRIRGKYAAVGRRAPTKMSLLARALQDGIIRLDEL